MRDTTYALSTTLVRPYKALQALLSSNIRFIFYFSFRGATVEHFIKMIKVCFTRLRDRFWCILRNEIDNKRAINDVKAACILHNIYCAETGLCSRTLEMVIPPNEEYADEVSESIMLCDIQAATI